MIEILHYQTEHDSVPFQDWLAGLDAMTKAKIQRHVERMKLGNFGDSKHLRSGVFEKKIDFGPGYRLYFGREADKIIVLLCGGNKGTQGRDIDRAIKYLRDHVERSR